MKSQIKYNCVTRTYIILKNEICSFNLNITGCPTRFRTRHFFNTSNTNEDIATKFEQEYVRCVTNEEECVCSAPNFCDTEHY